MFEQTDATIMELGRASGTLDQALKTNWSQGRELEFQLLHGSGTKSIILRIKDPTIGGRVVRASQRSSGFTHFFALKMILNARQQEYTANSYIFLFDEPGIYLHPLGQCDLIRELDTIGKSNQIVYATHSIYMLNKTFPLRHRLLVKEGSGTRLEGKPYKGRWASAIDALGFSLAGTILFAQYILLAEGESDHILIPAVFQKLVALGKADVDLNSFSVCSTGNSKNADALIRYFRLGAAKPQLGILVDGDDGGKARLKALKILLDKEGIESKQLPEGTAIEDHLPLVGELYVRAVANYVIKLMEAAGRAPVDVDEFRDKFKDSYRESFEEGKATAGVAQWADKAGETLGELNGPPSKVGIAREYALLLEEAAPESFTLTALKRPLKLLDYVRQCVDIPEVREIKTEILGAENQVED